MLLVISTLARDVQCFVANTDLAGRIILGDFLFRLLLQGTSEKLDSSEILCRRDVVLKTDQLDED